MQTGCFINDVCFNHLLYADDAVLLAPSPNALQTLLDLCNVFATDNDLVFSFKKTKVMIISSVILKEVVRPSFYLGSIKLPIVYEETYLGVIIRADRSDAASMYKAIRGMYAIGNMLKRKFKDCTEEVGIKLFKTYCSSFYCCSLWDSYATDLIRNVKICHIKVFRLFVKTSFLDSISMHFFKRNLWNFDIIRRKAIHSLYKRVLSSDNHLVNAVLSSCYFLHSRMFGTWKTNLF